jgi:hypothetical protein
VVSIPGVWKSSRIAPAVSVLSMSRATATMMARSFHPYSNRSTNQPRDDMTLLLVVQ